MWSCFAKDTKYYFGRGERMKSNIMPIPFEKAKIIQTVMRTYDTDFYPNNGLKELREKFADGWSVAHITRLEQCIEYILQKEVEE